MDDRAVSRSAALGAAGSQPPPIMSSTCLNAEGYLLLIKRGDRLNWRLLFSDTGTHEPVLKSGPNQRQSGRRS